MEDPEPAKPPTPEGEVANSGKKRVKPALKKKTVLLADKKPKKEIKWDEEVIEEHDQLRGTRMKIEEPNTPFTQYDSHSDGHESDDSSLRRPKSPVEQRNNHLDVEALHDKLTTVAQTTSYPPSSPSSHGDVSDEERHRQFVEHRKQHYNEMEMLRQFRQRHASLSDDDEENGGNEADDDLDL